MSIPVPYHRLARTDDHRWWRPVAGTLVVAVGGTALGLAVFLVFTLAAAAAGRPDGADEVPSFGPRADLAAAFLGIAALLPAALLAARWIQRRPAGTLSSVTGRVRWRWLLTCLPVAFVTIVVFLAAGLGLAAVTGDDTGLGDALTGWPSFLASMAVLILVVPPQAAAEEYVMRGWLLQGLGTWFRKPWVPIAAQAVVFAALHGWGTPWGFADLMIFGLVAGWLTVRTGGLEAAVALHVMNNLVSAVLSAAYGDLGLDETAADMPWQLAVVDLPVLLGYAAVIVRLSRRRGLTTRAVPVSTAPAPRAPHIVAAAPAAASPIR